MGGTHRLMHYYPHHIGDYQRDTAHLSVTEHGVYRLLMDHYYATEKPIPSDLNALCRIIRATTKVEKDAVATVAGQFFTANGNTLSHKRIEAEIAAYELIKQRNKNNGRLGGRKPNPKPLVTQSEPSGLALGIPNGTLPRTSTQEPVPPNPPRGAVNGAGITEGSDSKNIPTTDQSKRIAKIFHRREKTPWQTNEVRAYKKLGTIPDEDLAAVEAYYAANWPPCRDKNILRHDLLTFLNNFQGEVGRAYAAKEKPTTKPHDKRQHLHSNGATGLANAPGRYDTHGPSFRERLANLEPAPQIPGLQPAAGPHPG